MAALWRFMGRPVAWLVSAVLLIAVGADLRPWLDGEPLKITTPIALWRKVQRAALEVQVAFDDSNPLVRARSCLRDGDNVCAEFMLGRHLEAVPKDPRGLNLMAIAQNRLRKHAEAIAAAEQAFAAGQGDFGLFRAYADSLEQVGRNDDSIKWYFRALGVAPLSYEPHAALVRQLMARGRMDEALNLAIAWDAAAQRRNRRPEFTGQRILIEEALAKAPTQPRRAKAEIRLTRLDGHYHAPVKIGEARFAPFMVDTGATLTVLPREAFTAARPQATTLDRELEARVADNRKVKGMRVRLNEMQVGSVTLKGVEAFVCDGCAALLGQTTLQNFSMQQRPIDGVETLILTER